MWNNKTLIPFFLQRTRGRIGITALCISCYQSPVIISCRVAKGKPFLCNVVILSMKHTVWLFLSMLISASVSAQNWKPVRIDDSVQVSLPADFARSDTGAQVMITARPSFGNILITRQEDNPQATPDIEKVKHLHKYYDDFVKRIRNNSEGIITEERDTVIERLHMKEITLAVDSGSGKSFRKIRILHEAGATYTFQFMYKDMHEQYAQKSIDTFFSSIRIPPDAGVVSQFTKPGDTTGKAPGQTRWTYWAIGGAILLVIILLIVRRFRRLK